MDDMQANWDTWMVSRQAGVVKACCGCLGRARAMMSYDDVFGLTSQCCQIFQNFVGSIVRVLFVIWVSRID